MQFRPISEYDPRECPDDHVTLFYFDEGESGPYVLSGWQSARAFRTEFHVTAEPDMFAWIKLPLLPEDQAYALSCV